ncbi:MAG: iron-containing alcohol dehydrogenase [Brevinema sp.]
MDFQYFHIPTKIIQGYESFSGLSQLGEIARRRIILVTDNVFGYSGTAQNLRRYIENASYGLIPFEISTNPTSLELKEGALLVKESRAQTVVGFGNAEVLAIARAMAQQAADERISFHPDYIEIPTLPSLYPGLLSTYYITEDYDHIKRPYQDANSRASWLLLDGSYAEQMRVSDILTASFQSIAYTVEALLSRKFNFLGESYALRAIEILARAGMRLPNEPINTSLKVEMMVGALLASFAVESSSLGMTAALGMGLESSTICTEAEGAAATFIPALEYMLPQSTDKMQKLLSVLDIPKKEDVLENSFAVLEFFKTLYNQMELAPFSSFKATSFQLQNAARCAARYDFMSQTPRPAGYTELMTILNNASELSNVLPPADPISAL